MHCVARLLDASAASCPFNLLAAVIAQACAVKLDGQVARIAVHYPHGRRAGMLCRNKSTFARMSDPLGFVAKQDLLHAVKAVVAAQRDYGRRDDRKQSRLKYLVHEWGIDKFRSVVEQYFGKKMETSRC